MHWNISSLWAFWLLKVSPYKLFLILDFYFYGYIFFLFEKQQEPNV